MTKKFYNQPEVLVARIAMESVVLAGSAPDEPATNTMNVNEGIEGDQW